jgi:hypothetical protein
VASPIIQARAVERFYTQPDGNHIEVVHILPEGIALAEAGMLNRKILFREAALKHVTIPQCMHNGRPVLTRPVLEANHCLSAAKP